ncbi:MAG: ATP-binding protein [Actinomycetes bacterium]
MQLTLSLALPRDALSVPVVRGVLAESMETLGVHHECVDDIRVAISEACTNVLDHAREGDDYEVIAAIDDDTCRIEVVDRGYGFDGAKAGDELVAEDAERGRGIRLMRALVDNLLFVNRPKGGTVVCMEKELKWREGAPLPRLRDLSSATGETPPAR